MSPQQRLNSIAIIVADFILISSFYFIMEISPKFSKTLLPYVLMLKSLTKFLVLSFFFWGLHLAGYNYLFHLHPNCCLPSQSSHTLSPPCPFPFSERVESLLGTLGTPPNSGTSTLCRGRHILSH